MKNWKLLKKNSKRRICKTCGGSKSFRGWVGSIKQYSCRECGKVFFVALRRAA